ncbi:MAG: 7-carboxy-7-deazaguanine synthase, partial [Flavobacteriales bacterium]
MSAPFSHRDDALLISEIFRTVQGEGPSTGVVSTFLRLAHCNLRCTWCDTPFTWDWTRHDVRVEVHEHSVADVCSKVRAL